MRIEGGVRRFVEGPGWLPTILQGPENKGRRRRFRNVATTNDAAGYGWGRPLVDTGPAREGSKAQHS